MNETASRRLKRALPLLLALLAGIAVSACLYGGPPPTRVPPRPVLPFPVELIPTEIVFPTPLPTATPFPTPAPFEVVFPSPLPTATPFVFPAIPTPIFPTPLPTATPFVFPTQLPFPTALASVTPQSFPSPVPTATAVSTATPQPTATPARPADAESRNLVRKCLGDFPEDYVIGLSHYLSASRYTDGTGWLVNNRWRGDVDVLLTARHVLVPASPTPVSTSMVVYPNFPVNVAMRHRDAQARISQGNRRDFVVPTASSARLDIAMLTPSQQVLDKTEVWELEWNISRDLLGEEVMVLGVWYDYDADCIRNRDRAGSCHSHWLSRGIVTDLRGDRMTIDAEVMEGMSGGVVFDWSCKAIGLVVERVGVRGSSYPSGPVIAIAGDEIARWLGRR